MCVVLILQTEFSRYASNSIGTKPTKGLNLLKGGCKILFCIQCLQLIGLQ